MPENRARVYRRDAVWILGTLGGILLGALFDLNSIILTTIGQLRLEPTVFFAAICLYLYDVLDGRGWTLGMVLGVLALISIGLTDSWTHDFRAAQVIVTESSPPQGAVRAVPQTQQTRFPKVHILNSRRFLKIRKLSI